MQLGSLLDAGRLVVMVDLDYQSPNREELAEFFAVPLHAYGMNATDDEIHHEALVYEQGRSYGAKDNDRWVAGAGAFSLELTVPGSAQVAAAGITMIGVAPTHRRRGILTTLIRQLHEDAMQRGEFLAVLTASEASIYRRFGYGVAAESARLRVPTDAIEFDPPLEVTGTFRLVEPHVVTTELAEVFDRYRRNRSGHFARPDTWWAKVRHDPRSGREHGTQLFAVIHRDASGSPDGYATWRVRVHTSDARIATNTVAIVELVGLSADIELALWQFLAQIDLATTLTWDIAPVDVPLRWRLPEPRRMHITRRTDWMWARLLDVPQALAARTYAVPGTLVIAVDDPRIPTCGGVFRLVVDASGIAECTRVNTENREDAVDLQMAVAELSSIYFGGVAPSMLAAAGRITTETPAALALADTMFVTQPAPHCPIEF